MVSESIKNVVDRCHYPELHLEDKGSIAVELMLLGARNQSYILGYRRLARRLSGYFHLKIIVRVKSTAEPMTALKLITHRIVLVAPSNEADINKSFAC